MTRTTNPAAETLARFGRLGVYARTALRILVEQNRQPRKKEARELLAKGCVTGVTDGYPAIATDLGREVVALLAKRGR